MIWLNRFIAQILPFVPKSLVGLVARHYIAGETLAQALEKTQALNRSGFHATLDFLGEDPGKKEDCTRAVQVYEQILQAIHVNTLQAGISLKPSQMGLKLDKDFCRENIQHLVQAAEKHGIFVRIDMEDISLCQDTLDLFLGLHQQFSHVGIVIQAYLRRSLVDIDLMIAQGANIRLCKGAYAGEDRKTAYKNGDIVNASYVYLLEKLLSKGCFTGIATHDERLVFESLKLVDRLGLSKEAYEFQMLYGVEEELRHIILESGHRVRVYLPFGQDWFAYSVRRLKENPQVIGYVLDRGWQWIKELVTKAGPEK